MHYTGVYRRYDGYAYRYPNAPVDKCKLADLPLAEFECLHGEPDGKHPRDGGFQLAGLFGFVQQPVESRLVFFRLLLFLDHNLFSGRRADALAS